MSNRTFVDLFVVSAPVALVLLAAGRARADDLGALNTLFVLPVGIALLVGLLVVAIWGALGLRGWASRGMNVARIVALLACGGGSMVGAPVGVVLLELWTDQHRRVVTWNEVNFAIAGVVALSGLGGLALALVLAVRELRRSRG